MAIVVLVGFGWLSQRWGAQAYLVPGVFVALGAVLIWLSWRLQQPAPLVSTPAGSAARNKL